MRKFARFSLFLTWLVASLACSLIPLRLGAPPLTSAEQTATAIWATPGCDLERLEYDLNWQLTSDELAGNLQLSNPGSEVCRLNGSPALTVEDSSGQVLLIDQHPTTPDAPAFVLQPGETARAGFTWRNWCGDQPLGGLSLKISLTGYGGGYSYPLEDPNGLPLSDTPACMDTTSPSQLLVEPLVANPL